MCLTFNVIATQSSHSSVLLYLLLTPEYVCVCVCVCVCEGDPEGVLCERQM